MGAPRARAAPSAKGCAPARARAVQRHRPPGHRQEPAGGLEDGAVALPAPEQERSLSLMERPEPGVPPSWRERLRRLPWRNTAPPPPERFRVDRLGVTAT